MMQCIKCYSAEIDEEVWADCVTGEIKERGNLYYCNSCGSITDVVETNSPDVIDEYEKELTAIPKQKIQG